MPPELTTNQIDDIRDIRDLCAEFNTDFVIIGAIAYKLYFPDEDRFTADILRRSACGNNARPSIPYVALTASL